MIRLPVLQLFCLDIPALRGSEAVFPGVYHAVTACRSNRNFRGGSIVESVDDWETCQTVANIPGLCTAGMCRWEPSGWLRVQLTNGEIESISEKHMRLGRNRAMAGGEMVGFADAIRMDDGDYRLDGDSMMRGVRGTGRIAGEHSGAWMPFIMLSGQPIVFQELDPESVGMERQYKAVCHGQQTEDVQSHAMRPSGVNAAPFQWMWSGGWRQEQQHGI